MLLESAMFLHRAGVPRKIRAIAWSEYKSKGRKNSRLTDMRGNKRLFDEVYDKIQRHFLPNHSIAHQSQTVHFLIYAVLNAAYNPGVAIHDKLQDAFGCSHGSVRQLAETSSAIGVSLGKVKNTSAAVSLEWLLSQSFVRRWPLHLS